MIDHLKLHVRDVERSRAFSTAALEPLGSRVMLEQAPGVLGMGADHPDFGLAFEPDVARFAHVAFRVDTTALVDAFHRTAFDAGGRDNGPPGPRPQYHPRYYGGFVLDRAPRAKPVVGNNVEAVCHWAGTAA
jgi:catechol 2,3-dioxygenase-like lactoylglutathione lyase family enzyme